MLQKTVRFFKETKERGDFIVMSTNHGRVTWGAGAAQWWPSQKIHSHLNPWYL